MRKLTPPQIISIVLLATCVLNAARSLIVNYHREVFAPDGWIRLEHDLVRAKAVLRQLPERHIEYRREEASATYDAGTYYRLQYIFAPTILRQGGNQDQYVLVEFWTTKQVVPLPGLILLEDFGHGLGLYRRSLQ